jgi:hypothetical protein
MYPKAVYDASNGIPALSLPQGERFDATVLPYLEDFDLVSKYNFTF